MPLDWVPAKTSDAFGGNAHGCRGLLRLRARLLLAVPHRQEDSPAPAPSLQPALSPCDLRRRA